MQQKFMTRNLQLFFRNLTPVQTLVLIYSAAAILSVLLLALPIAHKPGVTITFTDLVFFAVSCVSVTGLTPIVVTDTFSTFGLFIILFIVQVSGVGLISLHVIMWILLGKRIGFRERQLILRDQNQTSMSGIIKYITEIVITVIAIEAVGAVVLGVHYLNYFIPSEKPSYKDCSGRSVRRRMPGLTLREVRSRHSVRTRSSSLRKSRS